MVTLLHDRPPVPYTTPDLQPWSRPTCPLKTLPPSPTPPPKSRCLLTGVVRHCGSFFVFSGSRSYLSSHLGSVTGPPFLLSPRRLPTCPPTQTNPSRSKLRSRVLRPGSVPRGPVGGDTPRLTHLPATYPGTPTSVITGKGPRVEDIPRCLCDPSRSESL